MDSARAYKFRLYPDPRRQYEIDRRIVLSQQLYNKILEQAKSAYEWDKKSKINKSTLNKYLKNAIKGNKEFLLIYSQTRQDIFARVQKAYQNFFRRVKTKKGKAGFPRFKSRDFYKSITYPQDNGSFAIENERRGIRMLRLSRIGRMRIEMHREIGGKAKTLTIKREAGKYYAVFSSVLDVGTPKVNDTNPVGIDVGLDSYAAFSNGNRILKPNFRKENREYIRKWQLRVSRKKKGSGNRKKAKLKLQKGWGRVNSQTDDFLQKTTTKLVNSDYTSFAMEDLRIQNMVRNHRLAESISGASWHRFRELLSYKAESAGKRVILVDARNTSKTCNRCGSMKEMPLSARVFRCECGYSNDRDINAAMNILKRATAGHAGSYASGDMTSTIQQGLQVASMNQEHTLQVAGEAHVL